MSSEDVFETSELLLKDNPNNVIYRLYRIKVNQIQMIRDRQYIIDDVESNITYDEFYSTYFSSGLEYSNLNRVYLHRYNGDVVYVYYIPRSTKSISGAIGTEWMQPVYQEMLILSQSKTPIRHYILIIEAPFTPKVRDEIATNYPYLRIEVFMFEEMLFNPTIHYLVPQHEVLTPDEVQELASHIDLSKIPWISVEDPIVRYYGYKVGDVLRIHRRNMVLDTIVDQYITYRMVKNTPLVRHTR